MKIGRPYGRSLTGQDGTLAIAAVTEYFLC